MIKEILGTDQFITLGAQYFWAGMGVLFMLLWHANHRDQDSPSTPTNFNFWFLLKDNFKRIALSIVTLIIILKFFREITGIELSQWWCCFVGATIDYGSMKLKEAFDVLKMPRKVQSEEFYKGSK